MSKKYIKGRKSLDFVYPNYELSEYDIDIIHDINNNCVSGNVINFVATSTSSSSMSFSFDYQWSKNGAEPFIYAADGSDTLALLSVHMLSPDTDYYKPWRVVHNVVQTGSTSGNTYSGSTSFTISSTNFQVASFSAGNYIFEFRFIGHRCIYPICATLSNLNTPTPTPTPTAIPPTATPTPTPTPTPTGPPEYTAAVYASTNSALSGGPSVVTVTYKIDSGSWSGFTATVSSNPNSPSFMLNISVPSGSTLYLGLRDVTDANNITAGYSTTIPAGTTGTCGRTSPQSIVVTGAVTAYLNAQVTGGAVVTC